MRTARVSSRERPLFEMLAEDSVLFFIGILASIFVLWRRTRPYPGLRPFGLLYIVGTHSSYNIMVKPINDYNLVVARTFMTHGKVVGPLSVLDTLMLVLMLAMLGWSRASERRSFRIPKEFRLIFLKDLALAGISLFLFGVLAAQTGSPLGGEIAWYRQILYYLVLFVFANRFLRRHPEVSLADVFVTFVWIDVINLICGFASTFIYGDLVWQRYFLNVTIIDQEDPMIAIMYPLMLAYMWIRKSTFGISRAVIGWSILITVLLLANFYKGSIAYIFLFLPFTAFWAIVRRRNALRPLVATLSILPAGMLFYWIFFIAFAATPLQTRQSQFTDLTTFMSALGDAYPVVGIGNGILYDRNSTEDDQGETKAIDNELDPGKASVMQSPGAQIYKATGLPGLVAHIVVLFVAGTLMIRKIIVDHPLSMAGGYLICMQFALNFTFLDPTGMVTFLVVKLFLFTTIARRTVQTGRTWVPSQPSGGD